MDYDPAIFHDVPYNTVQASACSPQITDPRFHGIAIRVPDRIAVAAGETLVLPICGYYLLGTAAVLFGEGLHIHLRSVSDPTLPPINAPVIEDHEVNAPEEPSPWGGPPRDPAIYANQASMSYFNLDAQQHVHRALGPGAYELFVSYGGARSNVARLTIMRR